MESNNESHREAPADEGFREEAQATTTTLTDLIDEMDRAAFRRSLASRDYPPNLTISSHSLSARSKR